MTDNTCPICLYQCDIVYTECNHGYCVPCLSRIIKCAICRKPLLRHKLCNAIKYNTGFTIEPVLRSHSQIDTLGTIMYFHYISTNQVISFTQQHIVSTPQPIVIREPYIPQPSDLDYVSRPLRTLTSSDIGVGRYYDNRGFKNHQTPRRRR